MTNLCVRAAKETQLSGRVEPNLLLKRLEPSLTEAFGMLYVSACETVIT